MSDDTTPIRDCTVCNDPTLCADNGLIRPIMGRGPTCLLATDPQAAFLYRVLQRLAVKLGVDISGLMRPDGEDTGAQS